MITQDIKTLRERVRSILEQYPRTRNSDIELTIALWVAYYPNRINKIKDNVYIELKDLWELPTQDAIKRVRAQIQNDDKQFIPTDKKIAIQRGWNEEEWIIALGYKNV